MVHNARLPSPGWSEQEKARAEALAAKPRLEKWDRGELAGLRLRGNDAQQREAQAILDRPDRHADAVKRVVADALGDREWQVSDMLRSDW